MYFTSVIRYSPEHGKELPYYKIKESFRDSLGRVHTRLMLTRVIFRICLAIILLEKIAGSL